mmetsp:Transcript_8233/g.23464  ORF Transcript_8233/g.23464 Transcript_8233/m.23464 type:complete len:305 (+) Transcript_8233:164-1078(+)
MASPSSSFCTRTPVAVRPWRAMSSPRWRTMVPLDVVSMTSSPSSTTLQQAMQSSSSPPFLNLIAVTPLPPRLHDLNSDASTRFPKPFFVTTSSDDGASSLSSAALGGRMSRSAIMSPSRSVRLLTPRALRPVARSCFWSASKRVTKPPTVATTTLSSLLQRRALSSRSPSSSTCAMSPRDEVVANAESSVFLIQPRLLTSTRNWLSSWRSADVTGTTPATLSSAPRGSTAGSGVPRAVRLARGTWKARMECTMPDVVAKSTVSWSLQVKNCVTASSSCPLWRAPALPRVPRRCAWKSLTGMRLM